ncbi:MAG: stealth conserved region 3 domain-containing protein [Halioglobus sp.]
MSSGVDAVYTWVNSDDPNWQKLYANEKDRLSIQHAHESVDNPARFKSRNEIVYSVRSIRRYASWIDRIFIVSNCALPPELRGLDEVIAVSHEALFPDASVLPTFNSRAIECNLHRIEGVAERILYFNDDVFLCQPLPKEFFFPGDHAVSVFPSKHPIPYGRTQGLRPVDYGALNACALLARDFDYKPERKLHHAPFPLLKKNLIELELKYSDLFSSTRAHKFRDNSDIPPATTLQAYYAVATGCGELRDIAARYVDIGDPLFPLLIHRFSPLRRGKYKTLCLNEVTQPRYFARARDRLVRRFLESMFHE